MASGRMMRQVYPIIRSKVNPLKDFFPLSNVYSHRRIVYGKMLNI
jgi:hypothetical protein